MSGVEGEKTVRDGSEGAAAGAARGPVPGRRWGKYLIEKRLGRGGEAQVYQAFDQVGVAGHVALKVPIDGSSAERVQAWGDTETRSLVQLDHPNIVQVRDAGSVDGVPYVATELIDRGLPLHEYVRLDPPPLRRVCRWMDCLVAAVHHAHRLGVVHRDIKPQNVVVTPKGIPLLVDFGIAGLRTAYDVPTQHGLSGTFEYMAPEQACQDPDADHRVDIFGLGGVLKFLLVGEGPYPKAEHPLAALEAAKAGRVIPIPVPRGPGRRRALCRIANRALDPDPDSRPANAGEMLQALRRLRARRSVLIAAAVGVLLAAGVMAAVAGFPRPSPPPADAVLEIRFQRSAEAGSFRVLTADQLPLRSGDRIQVHCTFNQAVRPYLIYVSSSGESRLLFPADGMEPGDVTDFRVPPSRNEWLPLTAPDGQETITFLLLVPREPLEDPNRIVAEILDRGAAPTIRGLGLLVGDKSGLRLIPTDPERGLGPPTRREGRSFVDTLFREDPDLWLLVRVLAFPHGDQDEPVTRVRGVSG